MEKMQWFKFSISEWKMGKIQRCTPEAKSSFMELCCLYWINETKLSIEDAIIECDEHNYQNLLSKKVIKEIDGFIKIYFLDEQFEYVLDKSEKARESVKKRWSKRNALVIESNNVSNTNVLETYCERNTEEKRREEKREDKELIYSFDEFWNLYGKKVDRKKCEEKYYKLSIEQITKIKEVLHLYVQSKPEVKFRKDPIRWLTGENWNDEIKQDVSISTQPLSQEAFINSLRNKF